MRVGTLVIYAVVIVLGALVISPGLAMLDLDPMPGDIDFVRQNLHIHVPVLYSLGTSVVLALLFWWGRR
jgi:hypothetical protein